MVILRKAQLVSLMQLQILTKPHCLECGASNILRHRFGSQL